MTSTSGGTDPGTSAVCRNFPTNTTRDALHPSSSVDANAACISAPTSVEPPPGRRKPDMGTDGRPEGGPYVLPTRCDHIPPVTPTMPTSRGRPSTSTARAASTLPVFGLGDCFAFALAKYYRRAPPVRERRLAEIRYRRRGLSIMDDPCTSHTTGSAYSSARFPRP